MIEVLKTNWPFPRCHEPHYESEAKYKAFHMKIISHSYANKTYFHMKSFALSLTFLRFETTRKWRIEQGKHPVVLMRKLRCKIHLIFCLFLSQGKLNLKLQYDPPPGSEGDTGGGGGEGGEEEEEGGEGDEEEEEGEEGGAEEPGIPGQPRKKRKKRYKAFCFIIQLCQLGP